ncbi:MAG: hypothetical protein KGI58_00160 [Patescibacteria group bacterium]|nr:hypothetical protein [Patescibacteria group bacterium]
MLDNIDNKIIEILGINKLSENERKEVVEKLGALIYQGVMLRALDIMDEEDRDTFEKLISENSDPEVIFTFVAEKIPDINEIISEETEKLKDYVTDIMSGIGK